MSILAHSSGQETASIPGQLVARLEAASVGSRELDCHVGLFARLDGKGRIGLHHGEYCIFDAGGVYAPQAYTTSFDAAMALADRVLGHCFWEMGHIAVIAGQRRYYATLSPETPSSDADAASPALAICIALLKARASRDASQVGTPEGVRPNPPETSAVGEGGAET